MIEGVYVVKDDLSGVFTFFGIHVNDAIARRSFLYTVDADGVPAKDLCLFRSGDFDHDTGLFISYSSPTFLERGFKNAEV